MYMAMVKNMFMFMYILMAFLSEFEGFMFICSYYVHGF
jgi:hypothetical protein